MTDLIKAAHLAYGIPSVVNRSRKRVISECRYVIMFFGQEWYGYNQTSLARALGGSNHTNASRASHIVRNLYRTYPEFREKIHSICVMVGIRPVEIRAILRTDKQRTISYKHFYLSTTVECE